MGGRLKRSLPRLMLAALTTGWIVFPVAAAPDHATLESQGEIAAAIQALAADSTRITDPRERARTRLRFALLQGDTSTAASVLRAGTLETETTALVTAWMALRAGSPGAARAALAGKPMPEALRGFAAALAAEAACELEDWEGSEVALRNARSATLPSEIQQRLAVLQARTALARGDTSKLNAIASEAGDAGRRDDRTGYLLLEAARAANRSGRLDLGLAWSLDVLEARPSPAESAYVDLRRMVASTPEEVIRLAKFEVRSGRHERGRERLTAALRQPASRPQHAEMYRVLADSYLRSGDAAAALKACESGAAAARSTPEAPELLRLRARALKNLGRRTDAMATYRDLARRFPSHAAADDALYEVGWQHEIRAAFAAAERAFLVCARTFRHGTLADDALLRAGLCALRDGRPGDAATHLQRMRARHRDSPLVDNALYWEMRARRARRDTATAAWCARRLQSIFPRSIYTAMAARGGLRTPSTPPANGEAGAARAERVQALYDHALASLRARTELAPPADFVAATSLWRFLLDHGLALEAGWEAQRLERHYDNRPGGLLALLSASVARGAHARQVRLAYRLSQQVTHPALAGAVETLLYPPPFAMSLAASAAHHGLSHAVLLGLVRQESAFDVRIDSRVGARGLMQLMPVVGARLATAGGDGDFHPDDLYRADINLELGCRLLADELRAANGHLPQALAAYNAGADRAAQWATRIHRHEPEELYLDLAEFYETRDYLKNVLGNIEMYRRLYALP